MKKETMFEDLPHDPCSYAEPKLARTKHIDLDWTVDFESKTLSGYAILHFDLNVSPVECITLDSSELKITNVVCEETGQSCKFELAPPDSNYGSKLTVVLPTLQTERQLKLRISYSTSPSASALTWLTPSQTSSKSLPFVFSQCQAIHARSLLPCQDTPGVKSTYAATVRCRPGYVVLMSALRDGDTERDQDLLVFKFRQPVVIPSYLIALVVGDLVSKDVGPRTKVWCEKEILDAATFEFAETEDMLCAAESLCGEYEWTQYDLLILPPSFPYGGMENPCLTFVTPTLLAGDRSLADVVAHEISHSWTGNLVTNCNWEHFWLNEGFTMFVERKIIQRLKGTKEQHLSAIQGWEDLKTCIATRGADDPLTCLIPCLEGVNPDDAFSTVPYEKGHTFLWFLEQLVGGPSEFEPFLKAYLSKFRRQSVGSKDFWSFLLNFFPSKENDLKAVDWNSWCKTPGMPPYEPSFDTSLVDACVSLCQSWVSWSIGAEPCPFTEKDLSTFSSNQIAVWLSKLLCSSLPVEKLQKMAELYKMDGYGNYEIRFRWLRLCIKARWNDKAEDALDFVNKQGRMKFVRPIYRDLYAWEEVRQRVLDNFNLHKNSLSFVAVYTLSKDLHLDSKK